jgi:hypothetical protein
VKLPRLFTARPPSRRVQWWVSFVLFTMLVTAWTLANPLFAGVDEGAHAIRAASVARGELIGSTRPGAPDHVRFVEVPKPFVRGSTAAGCYVGNPEGSAACAPSIDGGGDELALEPLSNGRFPPTPYGVVGLPSLVWPSSFGVYLMRALGAALCGALLASALLSLRETRIQWLAASGLAFALTPMVLYVTSIVNPSNLEIAGGVALWASGVVLVSKAREGVLDGRIAARTGIAAGVLVLARPLGVVWLGAAGAVLLLLCTWPALRLLIRSRVAQVWAGVVALCIAFELGWITYYDSLGSKTPLGPSADGLSTVQVFERTFGDTNKNYREMIGVFGWLDIPAPAITVVLWTAVLGVLVALGVGLGRRRMAAAIVALLGLIIVVPAVLEFIEAREFGFGWQGRYTLPLAVGLPILSGFTLATKPVRVLQRNRLTIVLAFAFVVAQFAAFYQNLRRYTVGRNGPLAFWRVADWSPPLASLLLLVAYAVLLVALALWFWAGVATAPPDALEDAEVTDRADAAITTRAQAEITAPA